MSSAAALGVGDYYFFQKSWTKVGKVLVEVKLMYNFIIDGLQIILKCIREYN